MQMNGNRELSLYFHLPFCTKKCHYCHFFVLPDKEELKQQLSYGLKKEWDARKQSIEQHNLVSIYFGGGTPYLYGAEEIDAILQRASPNSTVEITLEANPENMDENTLRSYFDIGINRLSIGVQSFSDPLLNKLTRTHSAKKAIDSILLAEEIGFQNISIDLMYEIPYQTFDDWKASLDVAASLPISHLSLYNLTIEPHTQYYKRKEELAKNLPDNETGTEMYLEAIRSMETAGLKQYEISAFAKEGCQSLHNSGYWKGRDFLGFGPSAFSYFNNKRFRNIANLSKYCTLDNPVDFVDELNQEERLRELFVIHLRLREGVSLNQKNCPKDLYKTLERLSHEGFVTLAPNHAKLTQKGMLFYDTVASELI